MKSPDGRYRLVVDSHCDITESGPISYGLQEYTLRVYEGGELRLTRESCRAWNDGDSPQESGLCSWAFSADSNRLLLYFFDGTTQEFVIGGS